MSFRDEFNQIECDFLKGESPQKRGCRFEKLMNDIFNDCELLVFPSYRTSGKVNEQIDGAVRISGRIFLLEIKWSQSKNIAESDLYAFLGKLRTKMPGTLGLFISFEKLSDNFINAIRYGQQQTCIVIHGRENIEQIIDQKFDLKKYLVYLYELASVKGVIELNVEDYLRLAPCEDSSVNKTFWTELVDDLRSDNISEQIFGLKYGVKNLGTFIENVIRIFPYLEYKDYKKYEMLLGFCCAKSAINFIQCFIKIVSEREFENILRPVCQIGGRFVQLQNFSSTFATMMENLKLSFSDNQIELDAYVQKLIDLLNKEKGNWENENVISQYVKIVIPALNQNQLKSLAVPYFEIYMSKSRKINNGYGRIFENKEVAKDIVSKIKNLPNTKNDIFIPFVKEELKSWNGMLSRFDERKASDCIDILMNHYIDEFADLGISRLDVVEAFNSLAD